MNSKIKNHAEILINYSLKLKKNDKIIISGNVSAMPLILECYKTAIKKGAFPRINLVPEEAGEIFFNCASDTQLKYVDPISIYEAKNTDCFISIMSSENTRILSKINPSKQAAARIARKKISDIILRKRWVLTLHPTNAYAVESDMSLNNFSDFVYSALFADKAKPEKEWYKLKTFQDKLIKSLKNKSTIKIIGKDTDLTMSIKGRRFINSAGTCNMPSGEIFTGPVENSINGKISYSFPAIYSGREVDGVSLEFKNGKVVKASAKKNEDFLLSMINLDKGASYAGELGIGTNFGIKNYIKNILFDEKIGGTIHIALGQSYPETGGKNKSALHWDMILDLRKNGMIIADGKPFMKNGKFLV